MPIAPAVTGVAIYSRVSTAQQNDEAQFEELLALCQRSGWTITHTFREKVSGTKGVDDRPELKRLLEAARKRQFGRVVVWSADRLGRSMRHLVNVLGELNNIGVHLYSYKQGIDTSTPMGSMLWQFLGIFAEFEHGIRRERQAMGIAKAKQRGVRFGRRPISLTKREQILTLRGNGMAINRIARQLGVGCGTVCRVLQAPQ